MDTWSSEPLGRYSGSYVVCYVRVVERSMRNRMGVSMTDLEWEKEGEPAQHIFRYLVLALRVDAKPLVTVQNLGTTWSGGPNEISARLGSYRFEISSKAATRGIQTKRPPS